MRLRNRFAIFLIITLLVIVFLETISDFPSVGGDIRLVEGWKNEFPEKILDLSKSRDDSVIFVIDELGIYALDSNSGNQLWFKKILSQAESSPPIEFNNSLYFTDSSNLVALISSSGKEIWRQPINREYIVDVSDELVITNERSKYIKAYDVFRGNNLWAVPVGRGNVYAHIYEDTVLIMDHGITIVDASSGEVIWKEGRDTIGYSNYHKEVVYYTSNGYLHAFDIKKRDLNWIKLIPENGLRVIDNYYDDLMMSDNSFLYCIDAKTGDIKWKIQMNGISSMTSLNEMYVVLEGFNGTISFFDVVTGNLLGYIRISLPKLSISDNQKMISTKDALYFFEGRVLYSYRLK